MDRVKLILVGGAQLCLLLTACVSIGFSIPVTEPESPPALQPESGPPAEPIPEFTTPQILTLTPREQDDFDLTLALLNSIQRQQLSVAADPAGWMESWWNAHDPTPGTPANEAFDVFQQRADYLRESFPGQSLTDIEEPWNSFLRFGPWDEILIGNGFIRTERFRRLETDRRRTRGEPAGVEQLEIIDMAATLVLIYQVPQPFHLSLLRGDVIDGWRPLTIPSLEGIWDLIEDPETELELRRGALRTLSWYELPEIADRLLGIPESVFKGLEEEFDACLRRLTVRRSYCIGRKGAQRLAVITAVGADTDFQLSRTLADDYPAHQFSADLEVLIETYQAARESTFRGLHPALRDDPEALINKLELQFASDLSTTGWDWRGDLSLVYGPPNNIIEESHTAQFIFGYPITYQVISGILGSVEVVTTADPIERYVGDLQEMIETGRAENRVAADNLMAMIPEVTSVSDSLIVQLNRLIPPSSRRVHYGLARLALDITADVITFPNRDGSIDIFASIGIPYNDVISRTTPTGIRTRAETSCVLFDGEGELVASIWHDEGFTIDSPEGGTENLFLVDSFNFTTDPGEYILYCSVRDPIAERATGRIFLLDLNVSETPGPVISPIALAANIEIGDTEHVFTRGEFQILPYPGRSLLFTEQIWIYAELSNLQRSEYGSYSWKETYYIIPAREDMGIISFSPGTEQTILRSYSERYIDVGLSTLEGEYGGPIYIVMMITDLVSGQSALAAAFFRIFRP
ncbi:hypothetical protein ACFL6R_00220 [Gemmatimonadota bacterium]